MSETNNAGCSYDEATKEQWVPYEGSVEAELRDQREENKTLKRQNNLLEQRNSNQEKTITDLKSDLQLQQESNRSMQRTILELQDEIKDHERKENEQLEVIKAMDAHAKQMSAHIVTLQENARPRVGLILDLMDPDAQDDLSPHSEGRITLNFCDGSESVNVTGLWINHPVLLKYSGAAIEKICVTDSGELMISIAQEDW